MKRILCVCMVFLLLLTACTSRKGETGKDLKLQYSQAIYELSFSTYRVSGWMFGDWIISYAHDSEIIKSGHRLVSSVGIFSFYSIQVTIAEKGSSDHAYCSALSVAICDGGFGTTEMEVTSHNGNTTVFRINCNVKQIGKQ